MKMIVILLILSVLCFTACNGGANDSSTKVVSDNDSSTASSATSSIIDEWITYDCKLIVKDNDISTRAPVKMHISSSNESKYYLELPVLVIMEELGAEVVWENDTTVTIMYNDKQCKLDTSAKVFGVLIPPGTTCAVRKVVDKEIFMDGETLNVWVKGWFGVNIYTDRDKHIVYV